MPPDFQLRQARATDLPALLALEATFPGDRMSARQFRHHLRSRRAMIQVAVDGQRVLGYFLALTRRGSPLARLYSIVVDTTAQGRGVGRRLLDAAERSAAGAGCTGMTLEVRQDNLAANALYQASGYHRMAALPAYYEDGADGWRYRRDWAREAVPENGVRASSVLTELALTPFPGSGTGSDTVS